MSIRGFERLIHPISTEEFFERYWDKRALHLHRARLNKLAGIDLGRAAVFAALERSAARQVRIFKRDARGRQRVGTIDPRLARQYYQRGMTICISALDPVRALGQILSGTKRALGSSGVLAANCYVSPAGEGLGLHFDDHGVFILQTQGRKRWRFGAAPAVHCPRRNLFGEQVWIDAYNRDHPCAKVSAPDVAALEERVVQPGDVLYLPAGTWHAASAEGSSVGLTIACPPFDFAHITPDALARTRAAEIDRR